jgi:hypothetical protein
MRRSYQLKIDYMRLIIISSVFSLFQFAFYLNAKSQSSTTEWECGKENKKVDIKKFAGSACSALILGYPAQCIYNHTYIFECWFEIIAGVNRSIDSDIVIKQKIQQWWNRYHDDCECELVSVSDKKINILKKAAQVLSTGFFYFVIDENDLDINFIDQEDGRTLLDYVKEEIGKKEMDGPDHPSTKASKKIFEMLRKNGALYASELPAK